MGTSFLQPWVVLAFGNLCPTVFGNVLNSALGTYVTLEYNFEPPSSLGALTPPLEPQHMTWGAHSILGPHKILILNFHSALGTSESYTFYYTF